MPTRANPKVIPFVIVGGAIGFGIYNATIADTEEVNTKVHHD